MAPPHSTRRVRKWREETRVVHARPSCCGLPREPQSENMPLTVQMLTDLCSVDKQDQSDEALLCNQTHAHTFTCFKRGEEKCRFGIPFWPMREKRILVPLAKEDKRRELYKRRVKNAMEKLETKSNGFL